LNADNELAHYIQFEKAKRRKNKFGEFEALNNCTVNLTGQTVVGPTILIDPCDHTSKLFFVFQDLCVRSKGTFKLACTIINMNQPWIVLDHLVSSSFEIYTKQYFPGRPEPTMLSKSFWMQGIVYLNVGIRLSGREYTKYQLT
jgi:hypothetical protein